ncbi:MAG: hypothetical protein AAGF95_12945, partial [Chloroflexota bacterium]
MVTVVGMDRSWQHLEKLVAEAKEQLLILERQLAQFDAQAAPEALVQQIEAKRTELASLKEQLAAKAEPVAVGAEQSEVS